MTTRRRIAARQLEILLNFAETHRDVALGRFSGGPQAARTSRDKWETVARELNSIEGGVSKTGDQWRRYWIELKAKTKGKAADSRRSAAATGGGPSKVLPLSDHEQRLLSIIGPVAVDGLPGVRLPVIIPTVDEDRAELRTPISAVESAEIGVAGPSCLVPSSEDSLEPMEEEWLESQSLRTTPTPSADLRPAQDESRPRQAPPSTGPQPVRRLSRQIPENAPQWAYEIESRRVAAEEQQAAAMQELAVAVAGLKEELGRQAVAIEALVEVIRAMHQK